MYLTRIYNSCEFVKVDPPTFKIVIGLVSGLLFSLGAVGRKYMDVAPLSSRPELLLLFYIFVVGVSDFE